MAVDRAIQVFSIASWCTATVEGEIETVDEVKRVVGGSSRVGHKQQLDHGA